MQNEIDTVNEFATELYTRIKPTLSNFSMHLQLKNVLSSDDIDIIDRGDTQTHRANKLIEILKTKSGFFVALIDVLKNANMADLASRMQASYALKLKSPAPPASRNDPRSLRIQRIVTLEDELVDLMRSNMDSFVRKFRNTLNADQIDIIDSQNTNMRKALKFIDILKGYVADDAVWKNLSETVAYAGGSDLARKLA